MRMAIGFAAALTAVTALTMPVPPVEAKVNTCERACRVVFSRGRSNCQVKVKKGIKVRQKACKTNATQTGFKSVQECRTKARAYGIALINATCRGSKNTTCISCCKNGGTKDVCAPKSPSGAFLALDGPVS